MAMTRALTILSPTGHSNHSPTAGLFCRPRMLLIILPPRSRSSIENAPMIFPPHVSSFFQCCFFTLSGCYRLKLLQHGDDAAPSCRSIGVASSQRVDNSLCRFSAGVDTVALDHRCGRPPDFHFGKHPDELP